MENDLTSSFLKPLKFILDQDSYSDCISWTSTGNEIQVHNKKKFTSLLPTFFNSCTTLKDFEKSLKLCGFKKKRNSLLTWSHPSSSPSIPEPIKVPASLQEIFSDIPNTSNCSFDSFITNIASHLQKDNKKLGVKYSSVLQSFRDHRVFSYKISHVCLNHIEFIKFSEDAVMNIFKFVESQKKLPEMSKLPNFIKKPPTQVPYSASLT